MTTQTKGEPTGAERRREPRILAQAPLEVSALVPSAEPRRTVWGRLLDASRGGLAFATEDEVEPGELLEISVARLDGEACLSKVEVQVVASHLWEGDVVAHCQFVSGPQAEAWLETLAPRS
jgi:hypothetical protein